MIKKDDILGYELPDGRTENVNAGETLHRGVELGLGVLLTQGLEMSLAWSVAEHTYEHWAPNESVEYSGNEMESAPNTVGQLGLTWAPPALPGLRMAVEWNRLGPYWMDAQNENEYEGHDLLAARARYDLSSGLGLFLRATNLTDERYAERASYNAFRGQEFAPGLPRTFYVGVEIR